MEYFNLISFSIVETTNTHMPLR